MHNILDELLAKSPLVAILRGITPEQVPAVAEALLTVGINIIEVPLNSPDRPLESIRILREVVGDRGICGAGTVLTTRQVEQVKEAGGQFVVSPNTNPAVITAALERGLAALPGCLTPTEAFVAIEAGAKHIKVFPGGDLGPAYIRSILAVIPPEVKTFVVGGVDADNMADFWAAGARGFGFGTNIYAPGDGVEEVVDKAKLLVDAADAIH